MRGLWAARQWHGERGRWLGCACPARHLPAGDGLIDLFVANGNGVNFLYHNEGSGSFSKVTTGDVVTDSGASNGAAWADYDGPPHGQPSGSGLGWQAG